jgi:hypothetical protein
MFIQEAGSTAYLSGAFTNAGTFQLSGALYFGSGSVLTNTGTFEAQGDTQMQLYTGAGNAFVNQGTFRRTGGGATTVYGSSSLAFTNGGTVEVPSGALVLDSDGSASGSFSVSAGATLEFGSGTFVLDANSHITSAGTVRFSGGTTTVGGSYSVSGTTAVTGGTANFNASASTATLNQSGGTLGGTGTLTVGTQLSWTGGTMSDAGTTAVAAGGQLTVSGPEAKYLYQGRSLRSAGAALWSGGALYLSGGAVLTNTGTFEAQGDTLLQLYSGGGNAFVNQGTFRRSGGGATTVGYGSTFTNGGTVEVPSGALVLDSDGSASGGFSVSAGATLEFGSGTFVLDANSHLTSAGTVRFSGGTTTVGGGYSVSGTTAVTGGTANFNASAITATLNQSGGTLGGTGTLTVATLTWTGGTMSDAGTTSVALGGQLTVGGPDPKYLYQGRSLRNAGAALWSGGALYLGGGPVLTNTGTFEAQGDTLLQLYSGGGNAFVNQGTFRRSGGGATTVGYGSAAFTNSGTVEVLAGTLYFGTSLTNYSNGTLTGGTYLIRGALQIDNVNIVTNSATLILDGPDARVIDYYGNDGLLNLANNTAGGSLSLQSGRVLTVSGGLRNAGTVVLGAASGLVVTLDYTQTAGTTTLAGGMLAANNVLLNQGSLTGSGDVFANLTNAALLAPGSPTAAGTLTVYGDYVQTATGTLAVKIGGRSPGTQYGQLIVIGQASLNGTLAVSLLTGFTPSAGDSFQVLLFALSSGDFATETGLSLGTSRLAPQYDGTSLTLRAV